MFCRDGVEVFGHTSIYHGDDVICKRELIAGYVVSFQFGVEWVSERANAAFPFSVCAPSADVALFGWIESHPPFWTNDCVRLLSRRFQAEDGRNHVTDKCWVYF